VSLNCYVRTRSKGAIVEVTVAAQEFVLSHSAEATGTRLSALPYPVSDLAGWTRGPRSHRSP
jgi:hypothetical protein